MKTTYKIVLGCIFLVFIGCGESSSNSTEITNGPKSPVVENKDKIPPSIPNI